MKVVFGRHRLGKYLKGSMGFNEMGNAVMRYRLGLVALR